MKLPDGIVSIEPAVFLRNSQDVLVDALRVGPIGIIQRDAEIGMILVSREDWDKLIKKVLDEDGKL